MTVSELIKKLSALEKQDQEVCLRGSYDLFIVPIKAVEECWGDGVDYVLSDGEPISQEQAERALLEHCGKANNITPDIETKAIQIAEEILKNTLRNIYEEEKNNRLDGVDWSDLRNFLCLMSACRKAVIDDFPLKDYIITDVLPHADEYVIMYFSEPSGKRMTQTVDTYVRVIVFQYFLGNPVAIPHSDKGDDLEARENCFNAVCECGNC